MVNLRTSVWGVIAAGTLAVLVPRVGHACTCEDSAIGPRFEAPCITVVDRSVTPIVEVEYDYDPIDLEVAYAGQTLRLIAVSEPLQRFPKWATVADWELARDTFADAPECLSLDPPDPSDVLELAPDWEGKHWFLTEQVPTTQEQASLGFQIDTSVLPEGNYFVYAYAFVGLFNEYFRIPTVWKVMDSEASAEALPPTVSIEFQPLDSDFYLPGQQYSLAGCSHGGTGTVVDLTWTSEDYQTGASAGSGSIARCLPGNEEFSVPFILPQETALSTVTISGLASDAEGRSSSAAPFWFLVGPETLSCADPEPPFYCADFVEGDPDALPDLDLCDDGDDDEGENDDDVVIDGDDGGNAGDGFSDYDEPGADNSVTSDGGCRIQAAGGAGLAAPLWAIFLLLRRRRW